MYINQSFRYPLICIFLLASTGLLAANVNFIKIETIIVKPRQAVEVLPYSINLESYPGPASKLVIQYSSNVKSDFIYLAKVAVDEKIYYRLVVGNFKTRKQAELVLTRIKKDYPGAWINTRTRPEQQQLARLLNSVIKQQSAQEIAVPKPDLKSIPPVKKPQPVQKIAVPRIDLNRKSVPKSEFAAELLEQAKQEYLNKNYSRVLAIADKIIEIGTDLQIQEAMELVGIVRERQNKFAQAIAIYTDFLSLVPDS